MKRVRYKAGEEIVFSYGDKESPVARAVILSISRASDEI